MRNPETWEGSWPVCAEPATPWVIVEKVSATAEKLIVSPAESRVIDSYVVFVETSFRLVESDIPSIVALRET